MIYQCVPNTNIRMIKYCVVYLECICCKYFSLRFPANHDVLYNQLPVAYSYPVALI